MLELRSPCGFTIFVEELQAIVRARCNAMNVMTMRWLRPAAGALSESCYGVARTGVLLAVALVAGACAQTGTKAETKPGASAPPVNLSGYSASFKEGFKHGCNSARDNERRDDARAAVDSQYAQGWQDGKAVCGKR